MIFIFESDAFNHSAKGKAPEGWSTPRRFALSRQPRLPCGHRIAEGGVILNGIIPAEAERGHQEARPTFHRLGGECSATEHYSKFNCQRSSGRELCLNPMTLWIWWHPFEDAIFSANVTSHDVGCQNQVASQTSERQCRAALACVPVLVMSGLTIRVDFSWGGRKENATVPF